MRKLWYMHWYAPGCDIQPVIANGPKRKAVARAANRLGRGWKLIWLVRK